MNHSTLLISDAILFVLCDKLSEMTHVSPCFLVANGRIVRSLMCVYMCGGSCVENVTSHLMKHLSMHPSLRTCRENAVFLLITALIRNFYKKLMQDKGIKAFGLKPTSRIKVFVFRFVSVSAKWIRTARQYVVIKRSPKGHCDLISLY